MLSMAPLTPKEKRIRGRMFFPCLADQAIMIHPLRIDNRTCSPHFRAHKAGHFKQFLEFGLAPHAPASADHDFGIFNPLFPRGFTLGVDQSDTGTGKVVRKANCDNTTGCRIIMQQLLKSPRPYGSHLGSFFRGDDRCDEIAAKRGGSLNQKAACIYFQPDAVRRQSGFESLGNPGCKFTAEIRGPDQKNIRLMLPDQTLGQNQIGFNAVILQKGIIG